MKLIAVLLFVCTSAFAQSAADPVFIVAAGATYNGTTTPKVSGWTSALFEAAPGLYSITTIDQTLKTSSLRSGLAKKIFAASGFTFLIHADAGLTTSTLGVTTNALGSFSGGPMLTYKIPRTKLYTAVVVRFVAITSQTVRPVYELGFGWGF